MNKVILMGRLARDAEITYSQSDSSMAIARFTLAVDRRVARNSGNDTVTADFIGCLAFGKRAEFLERFGKKGVKFAIEGRIQTGSYTDRDGNKKYTEDVVVENIEFAESKAAAGNSPSTNDNPRPAPKDADGFMNIPDGIDEQLPFN